MSSCSTKSEKNTMLADLIRRLILEMALEMNGHIHYIDIIMRNGIQNIYHFSLKSLGTWNSDAYVGCITDGPVWPGRVLFGTFCCEYCFASLLFSFMTKQNIFHNQFCMNKVIIT
jgi:hypothetical protein